MLKTEKWKRHCLALKTYTVLWTLAWKLKSEKKRKCHQVQLNHLNGSSESSSFWFGRWVLSWTARNFKQKVLYTSVTIIHPWFQGTTLDIYLDQSILNIYPNWWRLPSHLAQFHGKMFPPLQGLARWKTEKAMAPHSSTLAWKIPWTEEPGRLQSMRLLRVGWATSLWLFTFMPWRRQWQPSPVLLPGESQGWGSLVGCRLWGCTESDTTEVT